jgi:serine phosphatase RsbU (regulator of sigma subunit)
LSDQAKAGPLLRAAPPDRRPEAVADHLRENHGATYVEILLADLRMAALWPVLEPGQPNGDPMELRCFASQQPVVQTSPGHTKLLLPLTAWGDRLGVLRVDTAGRPDEEIADIADELAVALRAAGQDTDRYRRVQRRERLTMAAELQFELLPGRSLTGERFRLAAALEPAYAMYGDHYDWAIADDRLTLTVLNGSGDGMDAALLTTVAVNAMRNARRSGAGIVEQAELASDAVYARHGGTAYASTLLLEVDLISGEVDAVDAGSPRALITHDGDIRTVELEQQLPLGMFHDGRYETQHFALEPGDRLLIVSDGVHAAAPGGRIPYGTSALLTSLRRTRLQPPAEAVGTVMRGLREYHAGVEPEDDAVAVCLDWLR